MVRADILCCILELVRTHFAQPFSQKELGEEIPPFTHLNFLSENFGGQESGKGAEPHE